jgi:hypothetical protein
LKGNLTSEKATLLTLAFLVYALGAGYHAATRPNGQWRSPFSWHPFLMTFGMIGCMGIAAVTKKLGVSKSALGKILPDENLT